MSFAPPLPARLPCSRSNRLRFRTITRYGLNARKYTKKISEIAIIQADIRFLGRLCVKTYRNRPFRGPVGGFFRFALRTTKGATDTAIRGTATTCRRTELRGPIRPKFRFHAPPRPEHEPAAILESATRCLTLSPAAPPRSYRHKAALSPTLANELLGILHPYRIVILLYESYPISERHRITPTASVIRRPLPAATGRVYNSDPPLNPLLGGDFGRYAPKEGILEVHRIYNCLISAGTCCVATKHRIASRFPTAATPPSRPFVP